MTEKTKYKQNKKTATGALTLLIVEKHLENKTLYTE
jgi:hypothetical protein